MTDRIHLLIIDPQNDFCDLPGAALPVAGADADMQRLAAFVTRLGDRLDGIHVTLDSHQPLDIAHPRWWRNAAGESPAPFTLISAADVRDGIWQARDPQQQAYSQGYCEALEANGRYQLIIWPEHCLIGSWGHNVHSAVAGALADWGRQRLKTVDYVFKGTNPATEHYSAIRAEVPDPADPDTGLNRALIERLSAADTVVIAGEALSHCVAATVRDLADQLDPADISRLVLLTDCCSPVGGFEALGEQFLADLTARGMRTATSTEFLR